MLGRQDGATAHRLEWRIGQAAAKVGRERTERADPPDTNDRPWHNSPHSHRHLAGILDIGENRQIVPHEHRRTPSVRTEELRYSGLRKIPSFAKSGLREKKQD